jgi:hypothetical protein
VQPLLERARVVLGIARNVDTVLLEAGRELGRRQVRARVVRGRARMEGSLHRRIALMIAEPALDGGGVIARHLHPVRGEAGNEGGEALARRIRPPGRSGEGARGQRDAL